MHADVPAKEVMTREVCTASPEETLHVAAKKMIEFGVGSIVVVVGGEPKGIVTEKDILKIIAENKLPSEVRLEEIMSSPVITIQPKTSVREAAKIMLKKGIRRLPVIDGGKLVGIVTDTDILSISMDIGELIGLINEKTIEIVPEVMSGKCERCGRFAERLVEVNGMKLCEDCAESFED